MWIFKGDTWKNVSNSSALAKKVKSEIIEIGNTEIVEIVEIDKPVVKKANRKRKSNVNK